VLHCFTGGPGLARRAIAIGLYISFTGIVTFKKSDQLRAIAASLPDDRFLVETDAPYLAPGRYRGKRNEPAYVPETAKVLAEARGVSPEEFARQTTDNFFRLFSKTPRPASGDINSSVPSSACGSSSPSSAAAPPVASRDRRLAGATAIRAIPRTAGAGPRSWSNGATAPASRASWSTRRPICVSSCWRPTSIG